MAVSIKSKRRQPSQPVMHKIKADLRRRLRIGAWKAGERLPAYRKLAKEFGIPPDTMNRILADLNREGYLVRHHGSGTFVAERPPQPEIAGIYLAAEMFQGQGADFFRLLALRLQEMLLQQGIMPRFCLDPRPLAERCREPWDELDRLCTAHEIDVLAVVVMSPEQMPWFSGLPLPVVYAAYRPGQACVVPDHAAQIRAALAALQKRGIATAAMLAPYGVSPSEDCEPDHVDPVRYFYRQCRDYGLETRPEWVGCPEEKLSSAVLSEHAKGYLGLRRLFASSQQPGGVIIYPDSLASGAILGLASIAHTLPKLPDLVFIKNRELDIFCPYPAIFVELCIADMAEAMAEMLLSLYRGNAAKHKMIGCSVREWRPSAMCEDAGKTGKTTCARR